jgi:hypothetical protein
MTLPVPSVVVLRYVLDFTTPLVSLSRNTASLYVRFPSNVTRVGDEFSNVTSVNILLQQCTGKVVRLNIQYEITYSTTAVEFNTTTALVVVMERCNFVSAGTETIDCTEATGHLTL